MINTPLNACVAPIPGLYRMYGNAGFAANGAGIRVYFLFLNGVNELARNETPGLAATFSTKPVYAEYRLAAGDYIQLVAFQNSGAPLNTNVIAGVTPSFGISWASN